jgi:hypothetical protein
MGVAWHTRKDSAASFRADGKETEMKAEKHGKSRSDDGSPVLGGSRRANVDPSEITAAAFQAWKRDGRPCGIVAKLLLHRQVYLAWDRSGRPDDSYALYWHKAEEKLRSGKLACRTAAAA